MIKVEALQSFDHAGPRRRGERFYASKRTAEGLKNNGLVRILSGRSATSADPSAAVGTKSSASPAARASRRKTSSASDAGATADKAVQTSAPETAEAETPAPRSRLRKATEA